MCSFLVVHTDWDQQPLYPDQKEALEQLGAEVHPLSSRTRGEFLEAAGRVHAVLNSDFVLDRELLLALKRCLIISRYGTGVNNIDVESATELGIPVANVPGCATDAVADRTVLLLLSVTGNLLLSNRFVRAGKWGLQFLPFATDLRGKTLGLVGFGNISRAVAERARGFGLKIMAYDPYLKTEYMRKSDVLPVDLETLLRNSDFVSLHVPLTKETHHLLNEARISLLKPSCVLINTSRGAIIEERALVQALKERRLFAAGLDVFEEEPPPANHALFAMENVVLTPHSAAHTSGVTEGLRHATVDAVIAILKNERPKNLVNPGVWPNRRRVSASG